MKSEREKKHGCPNVLILDVHAPHTLLCPAIPSLSSQFVPTISAISPSSSPPLSPSPRPLSSRLCGTTKTEIPRRREAGGYGGRWPGLGGFASFVADFSSRWLPARSFLVAPPLPVWPRAVFYRVFSSFALFLLSGAFLLVHVSTCKTLLPP